MVSNKNNYKSGSKNRAAGKQPAAPTPNKSSKVWVVKKKPSNPQPIPSGGAATRIAKKATRQAKRTSLTNNALLDTIAQQKGTIDALEEKIDVTEESLRARAVYKLGNKYLDQNQTDELIATVLSGCDTFMGYTLTEDEVKHIHRFFVLPKGDEDIVKGHVVDGKKDVPMDTGEAKTEAATVAPSVVPITEEASLQCEAPSSENCELASSKFGREFRYRKQTPRPKYMDISTDDWDGLSDGEKKLVSKIAHHIEVSGLDLTSRRLAMQRLPLWLNACKLEDPDALFKGIDALKNMFDEPTIAVLVRQPQGRSILTWVLDCLLYVPRLLWWCVKWVVHQIFGILIPRVGEYEIWTEEVPELQDWCSDYWSDKVRKLGNSLSMPKFINRHATCAPRNFLVGISAATESVWCARTCIHNECRSLIRRQLLDPIGTEKTREALWKNNLLAFNEHFKCPNVLADKTEDFMLEEFLQKYPIARRDVIRNAYRLANTGHYDVTAYTKAFVKREWNLHKSEDKRDPRCISGKGEDYLAATAPQYYHMMKEICKEHWSDVDKIINTQTKFIYTGGLTPDQIGAIVSHYEHSGYHFYEGDYSRYDAHNEQEALDAEFKWYNITDTLRIQLRKQLNTSGGTQSGIRFSHKGKVASGVINTSFGNTIRGFMMIAGWCKSQHIKDYVVMQLGDDNVLMFKEPIDLQSLINFCTECGHKLEIVHRPDVDLLEFCSGRFWNTGETRVLGPKVGRVFARTFICNDPNMQYDQLGSYVQQVALGMRYYTWIPVLGHFLWKLMERNLQGTTGRVYKMPPRSFEHKMNLRREVTVAYDVVAAQFYKIYGFEPTYLEESLSNWQPKLGTHIHHPLLDVVCAIDGAKDPLSC